MKNKLVVIVLIVIIAGIAIFNNKSSENSDKQLVVGAILPLSGPTAQFGEIFNSGFKYGLLNSNVKVIYEDSKGDAATAVTAFQKLVNVDHVDVIVSNLSKPSIPLVSLAEENKVPMVMSLVAGTNATSKENLYSYRLFWTATQTGEAFAKRIINQGVKSVAILQSKNEATQSNVDVIIPMLEKAGVKVVLETAQDADVDFRTQLARIKAANTETLAILAIPSIQWKNMLTQVKELGLTIPTYDILGIFLNPGATETIGSLGEGIYTITMAGDLGIYNPEAHAAFEASQGHAIKGFESFGVDVGTLLTQLEKEEKFDRESIVEYLKDMKTFAGTSGPFTIDDAHNITTEAILAQFIGGKLVVSQK